MGRLLYISDIWYFNSIQEHQERCNFSIKNDHKLKVEKLEQEFETLTIKVSTLEKKVTFCTVWSDILQFVTYFVFDLLFIVIYILYLLIKQHEQDIKRLQLKVITGLIATIRNLSAFLQSLIVVSSQSFCQRILYFVALHHAFSL